MTFETGNYNNFENLVKYILPKKLDLIRQELLPKIERTLKDMLGSLSNTRGLSIDVLQISDKQILQSLSCTVVYEILDFKVPEASRDAIEEDEDTITNNISSEKAHVKKVEIDTQKGTLTIAYLIPVVTSAE